MFSQRIRDDLKAIGWMILLIIALLVYACESGMAGPLVHDYDIQFGTGDGPVGAEDPGVTTGGWTYLNPGTTTIQGTFDWIDSNWGPLVGAAGPWTASGGQVYLTDDGNVVYIESTATSGKTLEVYRDLASGSTDRELVNVRQDNAGDDQDCLVVANDGSGDAGSFSAASGIAIYGESNGVIGIQGLSVTGSAFYASSTGIDNDDYAFMANTGTGSKVGEAATFDEWNTSSSPYGVAPPTGDAREYYLNNDYWFALNDAGKVYGWSDRDADTYIDVEQSADEDKIRMGTGGTERGVLDSSALKITPEIRTEANFDVGGTDGVPISGTTTITVITDVDFAASMVQYRDLTFKGGLITAIGSESSWTSAPLSP